MLVQVIVLYPIYTPLVNLDEVAENIKAELGKGAPEVEVFSVSSGGHGKTHKEEVVTCPILVLHRGEAPLHHLGDAVYQAFTRYHDHLDFRIVLTEEDTHLKVLLPSS